MVEKHTNENRWSDYYEKTETMPPNALLEEALKHVSNKDCALDVGAGALRDAKHLLKAGFKEVIALDSAEQIAEIAAVIADPRLEVVTSTFDAYVYPIERVDLATAQFSLPFNPPNTFETVINGIKASLKHGGIFAGQLFGKRDAWNTGEGREMTFVSQEEAEGLFSDLQILKFKEEEGSDRPTASGKTKHWHIFHIIAKKE